MDKKIKAWLYDILKAIEEIEGYYKGELKNFNNFTKDLKTKRAIERNLEIIGEAISRILEVDSRFKIENARRIVDTRNRIIHGYDTVSDDIVWSIVIKHIPKLKKEVKKLLE
jgi:uncharacterized protein with HEPN domain